MSNAAFASAAPGYLMPECVGMCGLGAWAAMNVAGTGNDARTAQAALSHTITFPVPTRRISASASMRSP